jgi:AraC-like DNA-binding protein
VPEIAIPPSAYREYPPALDLRAYVACTWTSVSRAGLPAGLRPVIPDGCADIIAFGDAAAHVAGPATFTQWVRFPPPGALITGIRFRPGAVRAVLGCSAEALRNREAPLADICGRTSRPLLGALSRTGDQTRRRMAFESWTRAQLNATRLDGLVVTAASLLTRNPRLNLDVLTRTFDLTPRRLHREFVGAVGYGPKTLQRIMRLQMTLRIADAAAKPMRLAELACAAGYADQPHMTRDFRILTGFTPARYLADADPRVGWWLET